MNWKLENLISLCYSKIKRYLLTLPTFPIRLSNPRLLPPNDAKDGGTIKKGGEELQGKKRNFVETIDIQITLKN